jgi:hypothetical protein
MATRPVPNQEPIQRCASLDAPSWQRESAFGVCERDRYEIYLHLYIVAIYIFFISLLFFTC